MLTTLSIIFLSVLPLQRQKYALFRGSGAVISQQGWLCVLIQKPVSVEILYAQQAQVSVATHQRMFAALHHHAQSQMVPSAIQKPVSVEMLYAQQVQVFIATNHKICALLDHRALSQMALPSIPDHVDVETLNAQRQLDLFVTPLMV